MDRPLLVSLSPLPKGILEQYMAPFLQGTPVQLISVAELAPAEVPETIRKATILLGDFTFERPITAATIQHAEGIKLIQQPSVGTQHIDLAACRAKGIPVANAAGANDKSVAEHSILLALMLLKKALYFNASTQQGRWTQMEAFELGVFELAGKRWGIIGMGRIGRELAKRLVPFEVQTSYYDPRRLPDGDEKGLQVQYMPLEKLIRRSDIVSLHVPATPETHHMINEETLRTMRPGSYLINVARGDLVDETALASALNEGRIGGAGLDVFAHEPMHPEDPLLQAKNVVLTPHLAGTTNEARARIIEVSVKNIVRVLKGERPCNVVNGV